MVTFVALDVDRDLQCMVHFVALEMDTDLQRTVHKDLCI
jgi:hypothetical protein